MKIYFPVQVLDDTSAVLIPHKWVPESDVEDSDEMDDGEDFKMAEVLPVVKDDVKEATKEIKSKNKKKKKKKKKNNSKGVILGQFFLFQIYSLIRYSLTSFSLTLFESIHSLSLKYVSIDTEVVPKFNLKED